MSSACTNQAVNKVYACARRTRTRSFCYSKLVQKSEEGLRATQARAQRLSSLTAADRTSRNPDRRPVGSRTCKSGRSCPLLLLLHSEHRHHQRPQLRLLQRRRQRWAEHQCRAGSRTRRSFAERLLARRQRQQQNRTRRRRRGRSLRAGRSCVAHATESCWSVSTGEKSPELIVPFEQNGPCSCATTMKVCQFGEAKS